MRVIAARKPGQETVCGVKMGALQYRYWYRFIAIFDCFIIFFINIILFKYFLFFILYNLFIFFNHLSCGCVTQKKQKKKIKRKETAQLYLKTKCSLVCFKPHHQISFRLPLCCMIVVLIFLIRHYKIYISFIRSMAYVNHSPYFDFKSHRNIGNFPLSNKFIYIHICHKDKYTDKFLSLLKQIRQSSFFHKNYKFFGSVYETLLKLCKQIS